MIGFYLPPAAALHDTGWGHPEHQGRLRTLASTVGADLLALHGKVEQREAPEAPDEPLLRVHAAGYLAGIRAAVARARETGGSVEVGPETPVSEASWDAIAGSSGAVVDAVEQVADGGLARAFVACRPPGHHAGPARAMGFCAVNHVAVGARHLIATGRAERVAIVDWDVHHGNGTQEIFWRDGDVTFLSMHQWPLFPGTGRADEIGEGPGRGATRNVPLPAGSSRAETIAAFDAALAEVEAGFAPDFILISAGYDALAADPLGGLLLEPEDFHILARRVCAWADRACGGRVVAALEGGYAPRPTGEAVVATIRALADLPFDPTDGTGSDGSGPHRSAHDGSP